MIGRYQVRLNWWIHMLLTGVVYARQDKVKKLVTLGTPHLSIENYPFGRVKVVNSKLLCLFLVPLFNVHLQPFFWSWSHHAGTGVLQEKLLTFPNAPLPANVRCSSLQFVNYFYPSSDCFKATDVVSVVGKFAQGWLGALSQTYPNVSFPTLSFWFWCKGGKWALVNGHSTSLGWVLFLKMYPPGLLPICLTRFDISTGHSIAILPSACPPDSILMHIHLYSIGQLRRWICMGRWSVPLGVRPHAWVWTRDSG